MQTQAYNASHPHRERQKPGSRNSAAPSDWRTHFSHYLGHSLLRLGTLLFGSSVAAVIAVAWWYRDEGYLTAESGPGYWLGIAGGVVMLVLVGYPLRKRVRFLNRFGRMATWFRMHMVFGIIGPTLVILHTNFNLGSLNSQLALLTMLIVVTSGIVGRYLYGKVHKGLYGQYAELRDIIQDIVVLKASLGEVVASLPHVVERLEWHAARVASRPRLAMALTSGVRLGSERRRTLREIERTIAASPTWSSLPRRQRRAYLKNLDQRLRLFFAAVKKAERLRFYDGLFSMWHHLHLPLFATLALTVAIHIIAVHRY